MIFAIDPGQAGGVAWLSPEGAECAPMPQTPVDLADTLRGLVVAGFRTCALEKIPMHAGKNGSAMIKLGVRYGECRGALASLEVRVLELTPQEWQRTIGAGNKKDYGTKWKAHLKEKAQAFYPNLHITLKTADALLILEAGRRLAL